MLPDAGRCCLVTFFLIRIGAPGCPVLRRDALSKGVCPPAVHRVRPTRGISEVADRVPEPLRTAGRNAEVLVGCRQESLRDVSRQGAARPPPPVGAGSPPGRERGTPPPPPAPPPRRGPAAGPGAPPGGPAPRPRGAGRGRGGWGGGTSPGARKVLRGKTAALHKLNLS